MSLSADSRSTTFRKEDALEALKNIQTSGSFAASAALDQPPPCDISVPGIDGALHMPLDEAQARELIAKAHQAPYGKGEKTLIDRSVRNTWELDANQFTISGPEWEGWLRDLCEREIAPKLGVTGEIRAELYKMLIYEKGALFKPHTDTQKIPGMFGTLVVALPSAHSGGDIVLSHLGTEKVFKSSETSQSFACWYADVSHEVLPVASGYRWVLTFNLAVDPGSPRDEAAATPSAALQGAERARLRGSLRQWLSQLADGRRHPQLYHVLDHSYSEASISLTGLKGRDVAQVQVLRQLSRELGFELLFGSLQKITLEEEDHSDPDSDTPEAGTVWEETYKIKSVLDMDNNVVMRKIKLDGDSILDDKSFEGLWPENSEPGHAGNEGRVSKHWYRVTAVILIPHDSLISFLKPSESKDWKRNLGTVARYLRNCSPDDVGSRAREIFESICQPLWKPQTSTRGKKLDSVDLDDEGLRAVAEAAIQLNVYDVFERCAANHRGLMPFEFFTWVKRWLDDKNAASARSQRWAEVQRGLKVAVLEFDCLRLPLKAVSRICPLDQATADKARPDDPILVWAREILTECLDVEVAALKSKKRPRRLFRDDVPALLDMARYFPDPVAVIAEFAEKAKERGDHPAFTLAFMKKLLDPGFQQNEALYAEMLASFVANVEFSKMRANIPARQTRRGLPEPPTVDPGVVVRVDEIVDFVNILIADQPDGQDGQLMAAFIQRLGDQVPRLPVEDFNDLWIPFLWPLLQLISDREIPLGTARYQTLFSSMLTAYVDRFVGPRPQVRRHMFDRGEKLPKWKARKSVADNRMLKLVGPDVKKLVGPDLYERLFGEPDSLELTCRSIKKDG